MGRAERGECKKVRRVERLLSKVQLGRRGKASVGKRDMTDGVKVQRRENSMKGK